MSADVTTSRVLVVGSANVDYAVAAPRLPRVGETVTGGTLLVNHGGKGANQAVAARRLGAEVRFVACVGDDGPGLEIRAALEHEGIGVAGVSVTREAATGTALIVIDPEGRTGISSRTTSAPAARISRGPASSCASSRRRSRPRRGHSGRRDSTGPSPC